MVNSIRLSPRKKEWKKHKILTCEYYSSCQVDSSPSALNISFTTVTSINPIMLPGTTLRPQTWWMSHEWPLLLALRPKTCPSIAFRVAKFSFSKAFLFFFIASNCSEPIFIIVYHSLSRKTNMRASDLHLESIALSEAHVSLFSVILT